ncbi:MAG: N-acetylglucosamine-6-phosphate deacetylase [Acidimicrobiaceae bacterium]|nr:N-acetylglucosamine-6-phosphate deacetylase [Acidimicrobiaceae bacterium]
MSVSNSHSELRVARCITPNGLIENVSVGIDDHGFISEITQKSKSDFEFDVTLCPGFIDLQVNGIDEIDVSTADGQEWTTINHHLIRQGTTTWCPTLISNSRDNYAKSFGRIGSYLKTQSTVAPQIAGVHLEGPFLGEAPGAHESRNILHVNQDWIAQLPEFVKIMTLAPEQSLAPLAIDQLIKQGIVVSIGHTRATSEQFDAAVASGASMVTHLFNAMSGIHHRENGVALRALTCDQVAVGLIADLVHISCEAINLTFRAKRESDIYLVTDSIAWNNRTAKNRGIVVRDGAPRLPNSTLAGSCLTMNMAIKNLVTQCGIDLAVAVHAASQNPAKILQLTDRGRIEVGLRADLVALDKHFNVVASWIAGQRIR